MASKARKDLPAARDPWALRDQPGRKGRLAARELPALRDFKDLRGQPVLRA